MTVTTLERVELPVEDFEVSCEDCDHDAIYAVQTFCCLQLLCTCCLGAMTMFLSAHLGRFDGCPNHPKNRIKVTKISDFVKSVTPL